MNIDEIYSLRNNFSIVGLTGRTGSGCTRFSKIISSSIEYDKNLMIRRPEDIKLIDPKEDDNPLTDNNTLFKKKYTICYDFFKKNNKTYKTISYLSVLIFYSLHYAIRKGIITNKESFIESLYEIIKYNFKKSETEFDNDYIDIEISREEIAILTSDSDYKILLKLFKKIDSDLNTIKDEQLLDLFNCFYGIQFSKLTTKLFASVGQKDYYLGSFLVHGLGNKIRATGDPFRKTRNLDDKIDPKHIYSVVRVINKLIKAWKSHSSSSSCHICIDSLRNSLEIMFLKERYSAFYMIAIHNEGRCEERIRDRIMKLHDNGDKTNPNEIDLTIKKVVNLDKIENDGSSIKGGRFFAPDVENCIQKSEIHINNPGEDVDRFDKNTHRSTFFTMTEQWIKINALILHPGIITPSQEERCMQIAYNSKFNSGCISRQVGAIITDKNHSIKSVGWNDVPQGSIPCILRTLKDVIHPADINALDQSYSPFETDTSGKAYKDGGNFHENTKKHFAKCVAETDLLNLNHSFCFKTLHNKYELKDNQVHTRSLHAEENAMLQVSKFGGQPLTGGTLYTTASPCELCAKKAYQMGLKIVYIDPYPGISMEHILVNGYKQPSIKMFTGVIGRSYNKLFEPLLSFKDELNLITGSKEDKKIANKNKIKNLIKEVLGKDISMDIDLSKFEESVKYLYTDTTK